MTEILVGTKKGLFVLEGEVESGFDVKARAFPGQAVEYAMRDPRSGRYLASVTSWFYGGRIWVTDDPVGEWQEASGIALPEEGDASLARIWVIDRDGTVLARAGSLKPPAPELPPESIWGRIGRATIGPSLTSS